MKLICVKCKDDDITSRREEFLKTFSNLKINGKLPRAKIGWNGPGYIWPTVGNKRLEVWFDDNNGEMEVIYECPVSQDDTEVATARFGKTWVIQKIANFIKRKGEKQ